MKTDYPELEGTLFTMEGCKCKLIGASYHVGITAMDIDGKILRICLNRKIHSAKRGRAWYRKRFQLYIKLIKKGNFDVKDVLGTSARTLPIPYSQCAFGA